MQKFSTHRSDAVGSAFNGSTIRLKNLQGATPTAIGTADALHYGPFRPKDDQPGFTASPDIKHLEREKSGFETMFAGINRVLAVGKA